MERIRRDGCCEELRRWAEKWKVEKLGRDIASAGKGYTCLRLSDSNPYCEGVVEMPGSAMAELSLDRVIEVSVDSHELLRVNGEDVSGIEHAQVLNLSDDGERWEGDVLNNKPYGWGVLYDSENRRAYEGFRIGEVNVCYGTRYYSDIGVIEYEGEWCEGKRWGRGVHYDRSGKTIYEGGWLDDDHTIEKHVEMNEHCPLLHCYIEELRVQSNSCNGPEWCVLDLSFMSNLRLLEVGDICFESVKEVKLIGLSKLESVMIGKNCFTNQKNDDGYEPYGRFYVKNCERLKELKMGRYSFNDYSVCEIEKDASLEVIDIGNLNEKSDNFRYALLKLRSKYDGMQ